MVNLSHGLLPVLYLCSKHVPLPCQSHSMPLYHGSQGCATWQRCKQGAATNGSRPCGRAGRVAAPRAPEAVLRRAQNAERDQNPRGINRHKFRLEEANEAAQQPVVQALFDLCRFRNSHPAFNGKVWGACRSPSLLCAPGCQRLPDALHLSAVSLWPRYWVAASIRLGALYTAGWVMPREHTSDRGTMVPCVRAPRR